jgi:hypothetical protein
MVDQCERFIRDDFFELILGRAGARDVRRPRLGRHMIDPMPTERVVVDREFPFSSLNRRTRSEQPFDPHPLGMVASPTASKAAIAAYRSHKADREEKTGAPSRPISRAVSNTPNNNAD